MTRNSDYHLMLSRGRKAGLSARELNQALATRPVEGGERSPGQNDANGYICSVDAGGHRIYRQASTGKE